MVPPHGPSGAALLRGCGATTEKSAALLSVSVQPLAARSAAVVFDRHRVGAASKQLAVGPNPTRSMIVPPTGQAPLSAVVLLTSATFPAVPDIAIVPVASGVGRFVVPPAPWASCTR